MQYYLMNHSRTHFVTFWNSPEASWNGIPVNLLQMCGSKKLLLSLSSLTTVFKRIKHQFEIVFFICSLGIEFNYCETHYKI